MSDDDKWSRDGGKKDEDAEEPQEVDGLLIPEVEATKIPEVEAITPPPVKPSRAKKPGIIKHDTMLWTISVDEAVNYGFTTIKGVLPYLIAIIFCYAAALVSIYASYSFPDLYSSETKTMERIFMAFSFIFFVIAILTQLSLMIGLGYKFGGDVLLRAVRTHNSVQKKK